MQATPSAEDDSLATKPVSGPQTLEGDEELDQEQRRQLRCGMGRGSPPRICSQHEMCKRFLPVLREHGRVIKKTGRRLARPARCGEEVLTIVNGDVMAKVVVTDEESMVVRQESADHELYVLDAVKFRKNYDLPGADITESDPTSRELSGRNFKHYHRKGELRIYQVTEADLEHVPGGQFEVSFSSIPQSVRPGDYLVTVCPEMDEVYCSRHANIYNDDGQLAHGFGVRTQAEMCDHFIPILREKGSTIVKSGKRLAREAVKGEVVSTIVNGEVVAKTEVGDDTSMVVRQESVDHELYVLPADKFRSNYVLPGQDITDVCTQQDAQLEELQKRGFKYFERQGYLRIYQVTEEDMKFVPGMFQVSFSTIPQPLRVWDYLVTVYPEAKEIYMTRQPAMVYNDDGQFSQPGHFCAQEELRAHFLPTMRERGVKMRRAGTRLARPAVQGEEVLTIINNRVVFRTVVLDGTGMVVREESADHELYLFNKERFQLIFQPPGEEPESDALRSRGFKSYEMTKGMTMLYRIEESDSEFIQDRLFQMPFSAIPLPLQVGDYLATTFPEEDLVYLCPNAEHIYFSSENLEVHYVFSTPLDEEPLWLDRELEGLRTSGAVVSLTCATTENLVLLKKAWSRSANSVLHMSCHTAAGKDTGQTQVILEEPSGRRLTTSIGSFLDLIIGGGPAPAVVVLSSCHSEPVAAACLQRGVQRVVAVKGSEELLDKAAKDFAFSFYGELRAHRSVELAFGVAVEFMRGSSEVGVPSEADKFILLPASEPEFKMSAPERTAPSEASLELEPHVAVPVPFGAGEAGNIGPLVQPRSAVPLRGKVGRSHREFIVRTLEAFTKFRVLKVYGPEGMGKAHLAGLLAGFSAFPGGRFFASGALVLDRSACAGIPSQERMCEHFVPILRSKGKQVKKGGWRMARPARKGEEVLTVIDGEKVASVTVFDETSMVVRQETSDHELYVLDAEKFSKNYLLPGNEINDQGLEFDTMRERGFKWYERKGELLIYRVTDEDMKFMPSGKFEVPFSTIPQPIKIGDYLVAPLPHATEVYMTRNAEQIYATQIIRSQEEMKKHFSLAITRLGTLVKRVGEWLARPGVLGEKIETVVDGEVISRAAVVDETSMVVQAGSDGNSEWYILSAAEFRQHYELPGRDLSEVARGRDSPAPPQGRGLKLYRRRGMAKIYRVTDADLEFLPSGRFWGKHGTEPQLLSVGGHLVQEHPDGDEIYMSRNAERVFQAVPASEIVRSQAEMREHFVPIMKARGGVYRKLGARAARPARKGEKIRTLVDGEMVAKAVVQDENSMLVQRDTVDRELIVLSAENFSRNYVAPGTEIDEDGREFDLLRQRGFKYYNRRGKVFVYCVTEEDQEFVPAGQFWVPFSCIPMPIRVGDFLVADHPDCRVVYVHRNAMQSYLGIEMMDLNCTLNGTLNATQNTLGATLRSSCGDLETPTSSCRLSPMIAFESSDWNGHDRVPDTPWSLVTRIRSGVAATADVMAEDEQHGDTAHAVEMPIDGPMGSGCSSPARLRAATEPELAPRSEANSPEPSSSERSPSEKQSRSLRVRAELEEAICDAAYKQAEVTSRWYGAQAGALKRAGASCESEAAMAVDKWMDSSPAGSRALIILVDGLKYLTYDAPRKLLRSLMCNHPSLHLLVTVTAPPRQSSGLGPTSSLHPDKFDSLEAKAVAAAMLRCPLPLDSKVTEFPKMVPLPPLTQMEIAEVFLTAMLRGQQGRPLGQALSRMRWEEAINRLCCHPLVQSCNGLPGRAIWEAANVDPSVQSLEDLQPTLRI